MDKILFLILLTLTLTFASNLSAKSLPETELIEIELKGDIADRNSELSGLTWYKDNLILLPQYPNFPDYKGKGRIFCIPKAKLLERIVGDVALPIEPFEINIDMERFYSEIPGFEGFEAIAFQGDNVYLTIESETDRIKGFLIRGIINEDMSEIILDSLFIRDIEPQANVPNACEESLLIRDDLVITLYEGNGKNINPSPVAHIFDVKRDTMFTAIFPNLEYRITDATEFDEESRFWVINYFWPGEKEFYDPAEDLFVTKYGTGETHSLTEGVERLIEFRYYHGTFSLTASEPVLLKLDTEGRNLEGIVRFDDLGFLLCTDKFPRTILGFVPYTKID